MQTLKFLAMDTKALEKQHSFFDDVRANLKSFYFKIILKSLQFEMVAESNVQNILSKYSHFSTCPS